MHRHTRESLRSLSPDRALAYLKEGNSRFVNNLKTNHDLLQQVNDTADGQFPFATVLSCIDSRTSAELIFDQGLGDIFSIRIPGIILNEDILGSLEFTTQLMGAKIIMVLGHTQCGAIKGACDGIKLGHITSLLQKIEPALKAEKQTLDDRTGQNMQFVHRVTNLQIHHTVNNIRTQSSIIRELELQGTIKIVGGMYEIETGIVQFFEE